MADQFRQPPDLAPGCMEAATTYQLYQYGVALLVVDNTACSYSALQGTKGESGGDSSGWAKWETRDLGALGC